MFSKFSYTPLGSFYNNVINKYVTLGNELYSQNEDEVRQCLSTFISEDGIINGSALKEHWFSISQKDVFISHSHNDLNRVKAFAGWLYDCFGLTAFIDSASWGYCDDLLQKIDDRHCYNPKTNTYNYKKRNYTTSHVHMMLSTALTEMIDNTECIIFFNTPESIKISTELKKVEKKEATFSPWIYHELSMTTMLRNKKPDRKMQIIEHSNFDSRDKIEIEYDVSAAIRDMTVLKDSHLQSWSNEWVKRPDVLRFPEEALDVLYKIVYPNK